MCKSPRTAQVTGKMLHIQIVCKQLTNTIFFTFNPFAHTSKYFIREYQIGKITIS